MLMNISTKTEKKIRNYHPKLNQTKGGQWLWAAFSDGPIWVRTFPAFHMRRGTHSVPETSFYIFIWIPDGGRSPQTCRLNCNLPSSEFFRIYL